MRNFKVELPHFKKKKYDIVDFGAKSGQMVNNQAAIQKAIDFCAEKGGGMVVVPDGYFLTGPIELKSNVNLHLQANALLKFTKAKEEYPLLFTEYEGTKRIRAKSPISARNCTNIAITGNGLIDGSGDKWRAIKKFKLTEVEWQRCLEKSKFILKNKVTEIWCPTKTFYDGVLKGEPDYANPNALKIASKNWDIYRPVLVSLIGCDRILIEGVTIQNSPAWNIHPLYCKNFTLKDAFIKNKPSAHNGDGLDLESCENCEICGTIFDVGDDGICLKSGKGEEARKIKAPTKNVWIHDCKVFNGHGGFVVGSEMSRGVENVYVENCTFSGTDIGIRIKSALGRGGYVRNIHINNVFMSDIINEAILLTMKYVFSSVESAAETSPTKTRAEDVPVFHDFHINNIQCDNSSVGLKIEGIDKHSIHDINITNSYICCKKDKQISNCEKINLGNVKFDRIRKQK